MNIKLPVLSCELTHFLCCFVPCNSLAGPVYKYNDLKEVGVHGLPKHILLVQPSHKGILDIAAFPCSRHEKTYPAAFFHRRQAGIKSLQLFKKASLQAIGPEKSREYCLVSALGGKSRPYPFQISFLLLCPEPVYQRIPFFLFRFISRNNGFSC